MNQWLGPARGRSSPPRPSHRRQRRSAAASGAARAGAAPPDARRRCRSAAKQARRGVPSRRGQVWPGVGSSAAWPAGPGSSPCQSLTERYLLAACVSGHASSSAQRTRRPARTVWRRHASHARGTGSRTAGRSLSRRPAGGCRGGGGGGGQRGPPLGGPDAILLRGGQCGIMMFAARAWRAAVVRAPLRPSRSRCSESTDSEACQAANIMMPRPAGRLARDHRYRADATRRGACCV
jgi:hypothetical protein